MEPDSEEKKEEEQEKKQRLGEVSKIASNHARAVEHKETYSKKVRQKVDDPKKRKQYLDAQFGDKKTTKDIYNKTTEKPKDAKKRYGKNASKHSAETDHIVALEKISNGQQYNGFLSDDDNKTIANQDKNYAISNASDNRSKGSRRTNVEQSKRNGTSKEQQKVVWRKQAEAEIAVASKVVTLTVKNAGKTAVQGAVASAPDIFAATVLDPLLEGEELNAEEAVESGAKMAVSVGIETDCQVIVQGGLQYVEDKGMDLEVLKKAFGGDINGLAGGILTAANSVADILKIIDEKGELEAEDVRLNVRTNVKSAARQIVSAEVKIAVKAAIKKVADKIGGEIGKAIGGAAAGPLGAVIGWVAGYIAGALVGAVFDCIFPPNETAAYRAMINEVVLSEMENYRAKMEYELDRINEEYRAMTMLCFVQIRNGIYQNDFNGINKALADLGSLYGFQVDIPTIGQLEDNDYCIELGSVEVKEKKIPQRRTRNKQIGEKR